MSWTLRVYHDQEGKTFEDTVFEDQAVMYSTLRKPEPLALDESPFNINVDFGFAVFDDTTDQCIYSLDAKIANQHLSKSDPTPPFMAPVTEFTET